MDLLAVWLHVQADDLMTGWVAGSKGRYTCVG